MAYLLWNHLKGWSFLTVSTAEDLLWPVEAKKKNKSFCVCPRQKETKMWQNETGGGDGSKSDSDSYSQTLWSVGVPSELPYSWFIFPGGLSTNIRNRKNLRASNGRHLCFVSSEWTAHSVRKIGQQRDMTQTPLDLEREEEWGGEKKTRGEDKEDKEVGEEDKDWVPNWKAKDEPFSFLQCKWHRGKNWGEAISKCLSLLEKLL